MSSARNHAKRSHRSEHFKRVSMNASARRTAISKPYKAKKIGFFKKMANLFRRDDKARNREA